MVSRFSFYRLIPGHTNAYSLLANALLMCRFAAPLAFNFMAAIAMPVSKYDNYADVEDTVCSTPSPIFHPLSMWIPELQIAFCSMLVSKDMAVICSERCPCCEGIPGLRCHTMSVGMLTSLAVSCARHIKR